MAVTQGESHGGGESPVRDGKPGWRGHAAGWGCPLQQPGGVQGGSLPVAVYFLTGIHWAPCKRLETVWASRDTSGSPSIPRLSPASH